MSGPLTKEAKLTALVLAGPSKTRFGNPACALTRAADASGFKYGSSRLGHDCDATLVDFAATLGFSEPEALGIMNGWDESAKGQPGIFRENRVSWEAVEFGKRLYQLVHAAPATTTATSETK